MHTHTQTHVYNAFCAERERRREFKYWLCNFAVFICAPLYVTRAKRDVSRYYIFILYDFFISLSSRHGQFQPSRLNGEFRRGWNTRHWRWNCELVGCQRVTSNDNHQPPLALGVGKIDGNVYVLPCNSNILNKIKKGEKMIKIFFLYYHIIYYFFISKNNRVNDYMLYAFIPYK